MPDDGTGEALTLRERIAFELEVPLAPETALAFVRDVEASLGHAGFLEGLSVEAGAPARVRAALPVSTPLFGERRLPFASELHETPAGARLAPLPLDAPARGRAEVGGEAAVAAAADGSRLAYALEVAVHLDLPAADRWGTRALTRMLELTAASVLRGLLAHFPEAVERAARARAAAGASTADAPGLPRR